jgi:hypothetical protein
MNDFTKDELQIMYLDMTFYYQSTKILKESPKHLELREKIQKMIDSYCDPEKTTGWVYVRPDIEVISICESCKEFVKRNMLNPFTKDELINICRCVNPGVIDDDAYPLTDKLQDMIYNYCEHECRQDVGG